MVWPVREVLVGVSVRELVLDNVGACVDETRVGDHTEFFDFAGLNGFSCLPKSSFVPKILITKWTHNFLRLLIHLT